MPVSQELLDILACPMCKKDVEYRRDEGFLYCRKDDIRFYKERMEGKTTCPKCSGGLEEIEGEVLVCTECKRWYPIIDDIPHMLPDELREDLG
jgi:uncharacterized protein YbaR (Trm112 family)